MQKLYATDLSLRGNKKRKCFQHVTKRSESNKNLLIQFSPLPRLSTGNLIYNHPDERGLKHCERERNYI